VTETAFHVERNGSEVVLSIEVPPEEIRRKEQRLLAEARAHLKVPGFRPGKAPDHLLVRQYGEDEFSRDLKDELIGDWFSRALAELDLHPVTKPNVETVAFARGERLAFRAKFAVLPEVAIPDALAVDVPEPPPIEVTDAELQGVLAGLRRDAATLDPKEGPADEGDVVRIARAGRDWEGEATASLPIGKQLLGARFGERITLSEEDGRSEAFSVVGVYRVLLPTLEEAAEHYGHPSWEEFEKTVRAKLVQVAEGRRLHAWRMTALDAAAEALQVEVPPTLHAEAVAREMKETRIHPDAKPRLEEAVRRKLRREIVAQRLAEAKDLDPGPDEVDEMAEAVDRDEDAVRAAMILERAADWVIAQTAAADRRGAADAEKSGL
jgi:trigger factor